MERCGWIGCLATFTAGSIATVLYVLLLHLLHRAAAVAVTGACYLIQCDDKPLPMEFVIQLDPNAPAHMILWNVIVSAYACCYSVMILTSNLVEYTLFVMRYSPYVLAAIGALGMCFVSVAGLSARAGRAAPELTNG